MAPIGADQDVASGTPEPGDGRPPARIFGGILVQVGIGGEHKICVHLGLFHPPVESGKPVGERLLGVCHGHQCSCETNTVRIRPPGTFRGGFIGASLYAGGPRGSATPASVLSIVLPRLTIYILFSETESGNLGGLRPGAFDYLSESGLSGLDDFQDLQSSSACRSFAGEFHPHPNPPLKGEGTIEGPWALRAIPGLRGTQLPVLTARGGYCRRQSALRAGRSPGSDRPCAV